MKYSDQGSRWVSRGLLPTAAGPALGARILSNHVLTAELVLVVLANVALVLAYRRYRRSTGDWPGAQAGTAPPAMVGDPWMKPPTQSWSPAEPATSADDYPSWPGRPSPHALHPDHPSWPGRPDPRWAATEAALRADGDDYPSWPGPSGPPWRDAEQPADVSEPGWPGPAGPVSR